MSEEKQEINIVKSNLPGNSYKSKAEAREEKEEITEEAREAKKIISGEVTRTKRGFWGSIKDIFVGEDAESVGSHILYDIAIPAFKNFIYDSVTQGAEQTLFGRSSRGGGGGRGNAYPTGRSGYTSYNKVYRSAEKNEDPYDRHLDRRSRATHDFDTIVIETRGEAEQVLDHLTMMIDEYDVVKVADFYEAVGVTSSFQDNKWGWNNLSTANVRRARAGGFVLNLPRPIAI